jgi:CRP-like cAMP-binding protein
VTLDEPSRLLVLSRHAFRSVMDEFPTVREAVLETLAERVRGLDRDAYN